MSNNIYTTAYLGLCVPIVDDFRSVQQEVCTRYALIPRSEAHVTIGFFGSTSAARLISLATSLLDILPSSEVSEIRIDGLGGAYKEAGELRPITDEEPRRLIEFPRVLWLAATVAKEVYAFRKQAKLAAERVGVSTALIEPDFFPHLTLGSAGPSDKADWTLWDVHTVPKRATIDLRLSLQKVKASKLHLSDVSIHPASVHVLCDFSN
jgi:2'-5' RNA ligase